MSKAILELEMPESCGECRFSRQDRVGSSPYCEITRNCCEAVCAKRNSDCPLKLVSDYHNPADVEVLRKAKEALQHARTAYLNVREMWVYEYEEVREALAEIDKVSRGGKRNEWQV